MPRKLRSAKFSADRRGFLRTTLAGGATAAISAALYPALAAARSNEQGETPAPRSAQQPSRQHLP